jgi:hypothetical protein
MPASTNSQEILRVFLSKRVRVIILCGPKLVGIEALNAFLLVRHHYTSNSHTIRIPQSPVEFIGFFNRKMPIFLEVRQILSIALTKCGTTQIPPACDSLVQAARGRGGTP